MDYGQHLSSVDSSRPDDSASTDNSQTPTSQSIPTDAFSGYFNSSFQLAPLVSFPSAPSSRNFHTASSATLQTLPEDPQSSPRLTNRKMAATNNMHNLTTLIKRLEAATSRLEDIATSTELPKDAPPPSSNPSSATASAVSAPPPSAPAASPPKPAAEPLPEFIEDFDNFLSSSIDTYVKLSHEVSDIVGKQADSVSKGFHEQRKILLVSAKAKKPQLPDFQAILQPMNEAVMAAMEIKESSRGDKSYNHLSAVSDGVMLLGWIGLENRPYKHVDECLDSAQFFGNKVTKEFKDKDPKQVEWVKSFYQIFRDLSELLKQHFSNGLSWNPTGQSATEVAKSISQANGVSPPAPPPPAGGAPPPPPPPGPPPVLEIKAEAAPAASSAPSGLGAVFSDLNKGEAVTKGLRKVDKSEMTHKNPSLRAGSTVSDGSSVARAKSPAPGKKPKPESMRVKKPSRKELEGNKWLIENFEKETEPIEIEATLNQSILISRCNSTTIIIRGKANQVTVENSNRLSLVVDTLVSTVDVVKAQNFALQVMGTIPTVMLDQVDGASVYFSKESVATKVFTSKSAGININVITGTDDDYKEVPLPSQMCSYYDEAKGDLVNEIVAHAG